MRFFKHLINENSIEREFFRTFYKGTLRVLLVLLHDFPEFLSKYAYSFCEEIPEKFIQLRNIILASFPKTMRPPDPFYVNNVIFLIFDFFKKFAFFLKVGTNRRIETISNNLYSFF